MKHLFVLLFTSHGEMPIRKSNRSKFVAQGFDRFCSAFRAGTGLRSHFDELFFFVATFRTHEVVDRHTSTSYGEKNREVVEVKRD